MAGGVYRHASDGSIWSASVVRGLADTAADDQILAPFGHFGIEVAPDHPLRGFDRPAAAGKARFRGRALDARGRDIGHRGPPRGSSCARTAGFVPVAAV